jgi:hypothetical protein
MQGIFGYVVLAIVCSTAPTRLPVARWELHVSRAHGYTFRYPPCWTISSNNDDSTVSLSSPDGSFEVGIQVLSKKDSDRRLLIAKNEKPQSIRCYANERWYPGLEYETRSAIHRVFAINAPGRTLFITSEPPFVENAWEREAARIIASIRVVKIGS